ncbi:hypothetical protein [Arthrospiribacter ruber]|uniref:Uncharacterized protein n=1 Tax=Arthrospiribacter ruber TaxID=2487934 RepID=A0A951MBK6_9BACT|nr:hypothetical protein [Arthrospiribacter ruber]MBW3466405.1 hypothetical protein [Arthrospiribacter ruber]
MIKTKEKVCVTTFVFGDKYKSYIPLLLYSLKKAYPDYVPIIFIHGELSNKVQSLLKIIKDLGEFKLVENYFSEFDNLERKQGSALRWVIYEDYFLDFDFLYYVDIDIFYLREPIPLHSQHKNHIEKFELPFSNVKREKITDNRELKTIKKRFDSFGLINTLRQYFNGRVVENRFTGLHFVVPNEYFLRVKKAQDLLKEMLLDNSYLNEFQGFSDEPMLYWIIKESGYNVDLFGQYSEPNSLDFENYKSLDFRPHHGIHLAIFRENNFNKEKFSVILNSPAYQFYFEAFNYQIKSDPIFNLVLEGSDNFIKDQFSRMQLISN